MRSTIELRRFERDDFDELIGWIPDARFLRQWAGPGYTFPLTASQLAANQREAEIEPPARHIFRAVARRTGEALGHVELALPPDRPSGGRLCRGRLCRILAAPSHRGHGHGLRIVQLACAFAFEALHLGEIGLHVFDFNTPAIACYEKVGFAPTGAVTAHAFEGETWRSLEMSLPRARWSG